MQLLAYLFLLRHGIKQSFRNILRVARHKANPFYPFHRADAFEQLCKRVFFAAVKPVGIDVLPEEHNLAHAAFRKTSHLAEDILRRTASFPAAHIGNNAV